MFRLVFPIAALLVATLYNVVDAQVPGTNLRPRDGDGPRGRGGPGGPRGGPFGRPGVPRGNFTIVPLDCSPDSTTTDPECPADKDGNPKIWVCREGFDRETGEEITYSTCASPQRGPSTDDCGCCTQPCPQPCECGCDLRTENDNLGVLVIEQDGEETESHCMPPKLAFRKVTRNDHYSCDTSCTTVP